LQLRIGFLYSLERGHKGNFIQRWSRLLRIYVENHLIDFNEIVDACMKAIEAAEDGFMEDTPNFFAWMGEMLGTVICDANEGSLDAVRPIVDKAASKARDFVAQLLLTVQNEKSPETMERLWRSCKNLDASQLRLNDADFLGKKPHLRPLFESPPPDPPPSHTAAAPAPAIASSSEAPHPAASSNADEKLRDLEMYLRHQVTPSTTKDEIIDWIEENVPPSVRQSSQFIRALANQLCSSVIENPENKKSFADVHCKVLMKFVQGNRVFELATVEAAAEVCRLHQFPKGALLEFFEALRDECVIPPETFLLWWDQQRATPWSGMYVRDPLLKTFFTMLSEDS
jgi:hypothetical protein